MSTAPIRQLITRSMRNDQLRDLALGAVDAGFDGYIAGSGHLRLVNPTTGASVWLSLTSNGLGRVYKNARAAFKRAGFDPDKEHDMPKGQRVSPAQQEQIRTMRIAGLPTGEIAERVGVSGKAVRTYSPAEYRRGGALFQIAGAARGPAAVEAFDSSTAVAVMDKPEAAPVADFPVVQTISVPGNGLEKAGGRFKLRGPQDVVNVDGYLVTIGERVDGNWVAKTPDLSKMSRRRQWMDQNGRERLLARVQADLAKDPPQLPGQATEPAELPIAELVKSTTADFTSFPLIADLFGKQRRYRAMLTEAESLGDEDLQLVLMSKIELKPLEKEIIAYWEQTHRQQANGRNNGES